MSFDMAAESQITFQGVRKVLVRFGPSINVGLVNFLSRQQYFCLFAFLLNNRKRDIEIVKEKILGNCFIKENSLRKFIKKKVLEFFV